jgi:hypothetical protein
MSGAVPLDLSCEAKQISSGHFWNLLSILIFKALFLFCDCDVLEASVVVYSFFLNQLVD